MHSRTLAIVGVCLGFLLGPMTPGRGAAARAADAMEAVEAYFEEAARPGRRPQAARLGREFLASFDDDALALDSLAWGILTDETVLEPDLPLALEAARRAHAVTGETDVQVMETLARALVSTGRRAEGIAMHRRAIEACADDPSTRLVLKEILVDYLAPSSSAGLTDGQQIQRIEGEMRRLMEAGEVEPVARLLERTDVVPCRVPLPVAADTPLTSESLYERVRPSVVVMAALEPTEEGMHEVAIASGFVINSSGVIVTNYHVVDLPDAPALVAMTASGEIHPVTEILAVSPLADIAVCRIAARGLPPLPCVAGAKPGQRLYALSHPDAAFYSFTEGILSRYFVHRADGQAKTMFTTTADFAVGSSGGPLVDDCGNVMGMVSSTLAVYAGDEERDSPPPDEPGAPGDFQMGLNMCVPAADILRLVGGDAPMTSPGASPPQ